MRRFVRYALISTVALIVFAAAGLASAAWQYHQRMTISAANGITEAHFVRIDGIDQWVQIRGQDRANPVLLWLNGGPGCSTIPLTYFFNNWETHFTVVMWDQRGEGRTFAKSGTAVAPTMTIGRMTDDGIELANYLRAKLHKDKIVLLGHSWGSILGVHMAHKSSELFSIYVGTGQFEQARNSAISAYPRILARARAMQNAQAIRELEGVGPPPYANAERYFVAIKWANALDPQAISISSPGAIWALLGNSPCFSDPAATFSQNILLKPILAENLSASAPQLDVPVVIIAGTDDLVTPDACQFFDTVRAPKKEFLPINGGGHLAIATPDFDNLLVKQVLPWIEK